MRHNSVVQVSGAGPDRFAPLLASPPTPPAPPARRRLSVSPLTLVYLVGIYLAWLSAGPTPFQAAYEGASKPSDFTRDFIAAKMLAQGQPLSTLDGERGNREAVRAGAEPVNIIDGSPFHLHPPPASLPVLLLVPLGYRGASALWLGLEVALLGYLAWQLVALSARPGSRRRVRPWALFFLLILWPPVLTNFELGQWSIVLASLITAGYRAWDRDRPGRAAAWMATAAALKLMPVVLFAFVMRNRRAAAVFAAVVLGAVLIALPLGGGLDAWRAFARDVGLNVRSWQTWWHNTVSIHGLTARLFVGSRAVRPLVVAPGLVRVLDLVLGGGLCGVAWLIGRQARGARPAGLRVRAVEHPRRDPDAAGLDPLRAAAGVAGGARPARRRHAGGRPAAGAAAAAAADDGGGGVDAHRPQGVAVPARAAAACVTAADAVDVAAPLRRAPAVRRRRVGGAGTRHNTFLRNCPV